MLKKYKNGFYQFTLIGLLFPSSKTGDTNKMSVTCCELNKAIIALISGKITNTLRVINLDKINNWGKKGKSVW